MCREQQLQKDLLRNLARQGNGHTPQEIKSLAEIGVRLHNECPNADPAFLRRLGQRLRLQGGARAPAAPGVRLPQGSHVLLRVTAGALAAAALFLALMAWQPNLRTTQASLSRVITLFQQVQIEELPAQAATPPPPPEVLHTSGSLEEAQAAAEFAIRVPSYLPHELALCSVQMLEDQGQERVLLQYANSLAEGPGRRSLFVQQFHTSRTPEEETRTLQIDLQEAERLQVAGRTALWIPNRGRQRAGNLLLVQDGDVLIQLAGGLSRAESVRIVESMLR